MFALSHGELAIVVFIFALVWGAQALPRFAARLGELTARHRARRPRRGA
jgi:Sec-independent protein translocase protein TatA